MIPERTICRMVQEVSIDGRALPIPVVSAVDVDPAVAALDVTQLRLAAMDDAAAAAEANAGPHRETLAQTGTIATRGANFLCASAEASTPVSCQVLSPYRNNAPLVIYCDARQCEMPVLVRDDQLSVSATWRRDATDPDAVGLEITDKIQVIYDFLEGQV